MGMKAWLEDNNSTLKPRPPAKGTRHSQFGFIDNHSQAVRGSVHRIDGSFVERKVLATAEEVFALVGWSANTSRGRCGVAPTQSAFGIIPRDPLQTQVWDRMTSTQAGHEEQFLETVRSKRHWPQRVERGSSQGTNGQGRPSERSKVG